MYGVAKIDFILMDFAYSNDVPEVFLPLWLSFKNIRLVAVLLQCPPCGYRGFLGGKGTADFVRPLSVRCKRENLLHNPLRFLVNDEPVFLGMVNFIADWHDRGNVVAFPYRVNAVMNCNVPYALARKIKLRVLPVRI